MNQRRLSCVKFLGELYNYRQVESRVIFSTLYSFITFGNNQEGKYEKTNLYLLCWTILHSIYCLPNSFFSDFNDLQ